ncbi:hypothetical protein KCP75_13945 [Salmonella enterica subsp. enterica]|nr:hypothetical protein KCP75_13945 [Salmonella enterica subsp. enterica]
MALRLSGTHFTDYRTQKRLRLDGLYRLSDARRLLAGVAAPPTGVACATFKSAFRRICPPQEVLAGRLQIKQKGPVFRRGRFVI